MCYTIRYNSSLEIPRRTKRGLMDFLQKLSFRLELPSINWKKQVGNNQIGASMGIKAVNRVELRLRM